MKSVFLLSCMLFCFGCERVVPVSLQESDPDLEKSSRSPGELAFEARLAGIHEEWMGTPWSYSGTSQVPGEGAIACGYFVTTTLEQAGFSLERVRLAQAASETMIKEITPKESIRRFRDVPLQIFLEGVREQGDGYYIVGLDKHTGFLRVKKSGEIHFVHSGAGRGVVAESPENSRELVYSRYRVIGKVVESLALEHDYGR